ncbi:MAG TPA: HAD family phosphatase [Candidatus Saccharimonadales bacterium]|jgi:putative hydrolase of the HAD superfamily|nr:HAD family phosphatase [Candidatus Saccharimonadales bacterium]
MFKSVLVDYGLVLCRTPAKKSIDEILQIFGIDDSTFWTLYERNRGVYDRGELDGEEYWQRFARDTGSTLDPAQIDWLRRHDIEMWSQLEEDMLLWVDKLRAAGYQTSILSNLNKEFTRHMRTKCDWIQRFDFQVFSSEIGRIKPEPEIYQHCLKLLGSAPEETLFIDDRESNVLAARAQGIASVQFRSLGQLREDLGAMGFPVLPHSTKTT